MDVDVGVGVDVDVDVDVGVGGAHLLDLSLGSLPPLSGSTAKVFEDGA